MQSREHVAVVIPTFRASATILELLRRIGAEVESIYVVDDACPEGSGRLVRESVIDPRVTVLMHEVNQGVGGAVMTGYSAALSGGASVIVKIDSDGQMDPALLPRFLDPILRGEADYAKGNRFFNPDSLREMPAVRLFGNAVLSFMTKLSSGYWDLFDPTNGYTAIGASVARRLPFGKISRDFFFETDILFRLNLLRAVVVDVPMDAAYGREVSTLRIPRVVGEFMFKHVRNTLKRIFYNYYLRDVSLASLELPLGLLLLGFGLVFGGWHWIVSLREGLLTPAGTVMLSALSILMGLQLTLAFLSYDISTVPKRRNRSAFGETIDAASGKAVPENVRGAAGPRVFDEDALARLGESRSQSALAELPKEPGTWSSATGPQQRDDRTSVS